MPDSDYELKPVTHITTDAIGPSGKRVFYLQGWQNQKCITLIVEKIQVQSLAVGVEHFLDEVQEKFPQLSPAQEEFNEELMHILPPVDPLFRVGEIGLGFDIEQDLVMLVVKEITPDDAEVQEEREVRFWCTRSQLLALSKWGKQVVARGRPICPQCGEPMDPEGHFCPKRNGHKH